MSREMTGRIAMVTGANTGIGKEVAAALARQGAQVVMVCRSAERGREALAEVRAAATAAGAGGGAEILAIDLASLAAVRAGAAAFLARHERLHVLVNNAGVVCMSRQTSADGYELTFAVNQLAPFLLTQQLLPGLAAGAPARIVNVASRAHRGAHMHWDDLQFERKYGAAAAYGQSKLANILFTRELARRLDAAAIVANAVHPGVVSTDLVRGTPLFVRWGFRLFGLTPVQGAAGPVLLASDPRLAGVTGRYFDRTREAQPSAAARDDEAAKRLWDICATLTAA
jgi:NAD(P)-dependent dehydrogenase (short-subunit alcohol dehydrogenase family)